MRIWRRNETTSRARPAWTAVARCWRCTAATLSVGVVLALTAGACSTSTTSTTGGAQAGDPSPSPSPTLSAAKVKITPGNGSHAAKPSKGITVKVKDGTIVKIVARGNGGTVGGTMNDAHTSWQSKWSLSTGKQYLVRVTAVDADGRQITKMSRFRTLVAHTTADCQIYEGSGQTYGVGMPVMLTFSKPVENKKAVEQALVLKTSKPVVGAWYWDGDQSLWFRPRNYWPQNTKISFTGHLDGVQISSGVYTTHSLHQSWKIGRSLILVASASNHHMKVYKDRKLYATWPISTGRPGKDTPNGTYLSIEKANPQHMVGPDYDLMVPYSVRFTWSGDFVHAASWSVGSQGYVNVSHGCVNVGPSNAALYYSWSIPGDPVTVTGSPKAGGWDDGYTCWFLSWKQLWKGSATKMAVRVNENGSTFVKPYKIKKSHAKSPIDKPQSDNAAAS
jgi:lipoprotein-anchoring transpeptidase ErfK/SrfK